MRGAIITGLAIGAMAIEAALEENTVAADTATGAVVAMVVDAVTMAVIVS
ncbi:hypothetical protein GCM10011585_09190 [Edaphobacter dinghuensis]|uniref:Uncharacterized protein n=1 Tax=Edaphobacter dinghuensis TaxID=1560005 RepID=A0A917H6G5_9BACT|nr:hypothetical protein GCM10011585_09190 [Edaphobacter dinghuensis]